MKIIRCATRNPGKLREFRSATEFFGYDCVSLDCIEHIDSLPDCVEDGDTFEANAIKKAVHYSVHAHRPVFADDSGLEVDALNGAPGVYSARFAGPGANDESNNRLLLDKLAGVSNRAARFVCVVALAHEGRLLGTFRGEVPGRIIDEPKGVNGFGYDPLFFHEPFGCTFGEAPADRKLGVSHRGQALAQMLKFACERL